MSMVDEHTEATPSQPPKGLVCPHCGGDDLGVDYTRDKPGEIYRRRECKACGADIRTGETIRWSKPPAA